MAKLRFKRIMKIKDVNPYVDVTKVQAEKLMKNWRKPLPVLVRVNGHPKDAWHINMVPVGNGDFYLYLHGEVRKASGTKVRDTVTIELNFDAEYSSGPQHPMPTEFSKLLHNDPDAKTNWDLLTPSRKKEILRYLANLKTEEAKKRNYQRTMDALSGNRVQYMGRDWRDGK